jgi:3-dehydroquinate synthase
VCINHKIKIVTQDKHDQGIRNILNFGHTIGHALESYYKFELSHGQAVLYGMKAACFLSLEKQNISRAQYDRIIKILNKLDITPLHDLDINKVLSFIETDKKNIGGQLNYILLNGIGSAYIEKNYNKDNLIKGLEIL